mmetsp:Transcript_6435/g.12093  ORF Transcript_6435/g.12093 Transcript_6435/m.12093 type:complete len:198 (+) Transcript_6435:856-1449(+)
MRMKTCAEDEMGKFLKPTSIVPPPQTKCQSRDRTRTASTQPLRHLRLSPLNLPARSNVLALIASHRNRKPIPVVALRARLDPSSARYPGSSRRLLHRVNRMQETALRQGCPSSRLMLDHNLHMDMRPILILTVTPRTRIHRTHMDTLIHTRLTSHTQGLHRHHHLPNMRHNHQINNPINNISNNEMKIKHRSIRTRM